MARKEKTCFLSRRWRPNDWPFWSLMGIEFALTVALLTFVGIASPNLYRTKLQADGAEHGWNSSPAAAMYAAVNGRPYKLPIVWSQFLTNFNLVIVVLSMFFMLVKSTMFMLHVFPPIISIAIHSLLTILFAVSAAFQAGSDMSDPKRPQSGPPWYITKSCQLANHPFNVGYCQQAKATFACTVTILGVFLGYLALSIYSCFPSAEHRAEYAEKKRLQREKYGFLDEAEEDEDEYNGMEGQRMVTLNPAVSSTALNPMTPRTLAFNKLGGTKDLPLRIQTTKANAVQVASQEVPQTQQAKKRDSRTSFLGFSLRSPGLPRTPGNQARFAEVPLTPDHHQDDNITVASSANPMYFPPPPKQSSKK